MKIKKIYPFLTCVLGLMLSFIPETQGMELIALDFFVHNRSKPQFFWGPLPLTYITKIASCFKIKSIYTVIRPYDIEKDYQDIMKVFNDQENWNFLIHSPRNKEAEEFIQKLFTTRIFPNFDPNPKLEIFVLHHLNRFAGFVAFCKADKDNGHIALLHVNKTYRGAHYAEKLLKAATDNLFKNGAKLIWLYTGEHNYRAQNLYKKSGFSVFDTREGCVYFEKHKK